jgi:hypothetical protein
MHCPECGTEMGPSHQACPQCGRVPYAAPPTSPQPLPVATVSSLGEDAGMRWLLPVGRSGLAIAAGYLGLLAIFPPFAPFALLLGIMAVWDIRRNPHKRGLGRAIFAIVMGVLFTALLAMILIIASDPNL